MKKRTREPGLLQCAHLILPWLSPTDLAAASATCKALYLASSTITSRRAADASRGLETHPIPFLNPIDVQPYSFFIYTISPLLDTSTFSQPWGGFELSSPKLSPFFPSPFHVGCDCEDCSLEDCMCEGPGVMLGEGEGMEMMRECGVNCRCGMECRNRSTQKGVSVRLRIVRDRKKGWGLHAGELIARGEFVCEYAGEFLTTQESRRRQRIYDELAHSGRLSPALLVVREHLPSGKACLRVNIDATRVGNVARFINHSCDGGNLSPVLVRNSGSLLPRLCFFAASDIPEGEELTFSYGDARLRQNGLPCFCGSSICLGMLPSEDT